MNIEQVIIYINELLESANNDNMDDDTNNVLYVTILEDTYQISEVSLKDMTLLEVPTANLFTVHVSEDSLRTLLHNLVKYCSKHDVAIPSLLLEIL